MKRGVCSDKNYILGPELLKAIRRGYKRLATGLLGRGANPNVRDACGFALTKAIRGGYEGLAIELLGRGANPDVRDACGFALTQAIKRS